jgi:hypothetical protein
MLCGTMPNPRLCRIEILKRSGNSVNPADAPSCYSAPRGIVRCASQSMEEAQHLPSGRLTIFPFLWSASSAPQPTASARLVSRPAKNVRRSMSLPNPSWICSVFRSSTGARLCRIAEVRKSSGYCHGAVIRHIPEFGIVHAYAAFGIAWRTFPDRGWQAHAERESAAKTGRAL